MIIIAPLALSDWRWLEDIAVEEAEKIAPYLTPDRERMKNLFTESVSGANHYAVKAVSNDEPVGTLIAMTAPNLWARKQCSNGLIVTSKLAPAGAVLIKAYRKWLESRAVLRVGGFSPAVDLPERTTQLMEKCGFPQQGGCYLYTVR